MVNSWNPRFWLLLSPLLAGLVILSWPRPCHAALLNDIRIGEYDKFTRIVFEFNIHTAIDSIEKVRPGELKITFQGARAEFVRSIPLKYSERLKNFEVWQYKNKISVIFRFNYKKMRFDNFQLKSPPRTVVDVYQDLSQTELSGEQNNQPIKITQEIIPYSGDKAPLAPNEKNQHPPLPRDRLSLPFNGQPSGSAILDRSAAGKPTNDINQISKQSDSQSEESEESVESEESDIASTLIKPAIAPQQPGREQTDSLPNEAVADAAPGLLKKGLQYYLLIALVVLTIVILTLLVIMLFSRHKWTNGKKSLKIEDLLHRQDQDIATINSQIEEHLKRYDEI